MKIWIEKKDTWPVPGEFIGILCKPAPVPPHCWWFQKSSPFVYAGNWFDTLDLTSGIITKKEDTTYPENETNTGGAECIKYTVRIHGVDVEIYSSDFLAYEIDERVAIYKYRGKDTKPVEMQYEVRDKDSKKDIPFNQHEQQLLGDPSVNMDGTPLELFTYVILPLTFYK
jgi:hypothetical protein